MFTFWSNILDHHLLMNTIKLLLRRKTGPAFWSLTENREASYYYLHEDAPSLFLKNPSSSSNHLVKPNCTHTRASNSFKQLFSSVCVVLHVYFRILHFPFAKLWNCSMQCAVVEIVPMDKLVCTGMVLFRFILHPAFIYHLSRKHYYLVIHCISFKSFFNLFFLSIFNIFRWTI